MGTIEKMMHSRNVLLLAAGLLIISRLRTEPRYRAQ